jgi:hypothetical protein
VIFTLRLEKFTKIHCVSQEKYHISYVHKTQTHTPEELSGLAEKLQSNWWREWMKTPFYRIPIYLYIYSVTQREERVREKKM